MFKPLAVGVAALVLLSGWGCASAPRAGEVVMEASATEAHVTLPAGGVAAGQRVRIYRDVSTGGKAAHTRKTLIGEGTVIRLMGDKYAAIEVAPGVQYRMGDYAERE